MGNMIAVTSQACKHVDLMVGRILYVHTVIKFIALFDSSVRNGKLSVKSQFSADPYCAPYSRDHVNARKMIL